MAKRDFTKNNPLDRFGTAAEPSEPIKTVEPDKTSDKKKRKYLRLDVEDYHEYIRIMSEHNGVTMTNYIQGLIKKDKEENAVLFGKLERIEQMKKDL